MASFFVFLLHWFNHTRNALFCPSLSFSYRWRLLALQPLTLLTYSLKYFPYLFSRRYSVIEIATRRKHTIRAIVFLPKREVESKPRPLHIDFHGGAFLGGIAEYDAPFCELLSDRAGAVVISSQYRHAPANLYPCAHEDAEDVIDWVLKNAKRQWNADPESLTVSGSSAGGNLMMLASSRAKAAVGICAVVDFRIPPWMKPRPPNFPQTDPLFWLEPLFDTYAGGSESLQILRKNDARLSPILMNVDELPRHILLIVAGIDILLHEQLTFIDRLKRDKESTEHGDPRVFESIVFDKAFHGSFELPSIVIGQEGVRDREKAYSAAIEFLIGAHRGENPVVKGC